MSECAPYWYTDQSSVCPYGTYLFGDVTLPTSPTVFQYIALFYAYAAYIVIAVLSVVLCRATTWHSRKHWFAYLIFIGLCVGFNELLFKRLMRQARPGSTGLLTDDDGKHVGSCNTSCGMPSSHSLVSVGLMTLLIVDTAFRIVKPLGCECVLFPTGIFSAQQFNVSFGIWTALLSPIPMSRVVLYDHSPAQVAVGSTLGFVLAIAWFACMRTILGRSEHPEALRHIITELESGSSNNE